MHRSIGLSSLGAAALFLAACSGGGGSPSPVSTTNPNATLVLVPGTVAKYTGTDSTVHVYSSPSATQSNFTGSYTFAATRTIENAASGSPANYDINTLTAYTVTQDPGQGIAKQSETSDAFSNQVAVTGGTSVQNVSNKTTAVGTDETAGASGGGPFTQTVTTTTNYTSPQITGVYPLVTGATMAEPIARSVAATTTDANGGVTETATTFALSSNDSFGSDGTYTDTIDQSNGQTQTTVESSNGSATVDSNGPVFALNDTIAVPASGGSGYTIPVTTYRQYATTGATPAPTATTLAYAATDWYPGNALPAAPFQTDNVTVKGPATSLPSGCSGAISEPNVYEVDMSATTLNLDASYATTTQQRFDSNGTPVCVLRTVTTQDYGLTTGSLNQTTTETFAEVLTSLTLGSASASTARTLK